MPTSSLAYWLAAFHLPGIGPKTILQWLSVIPTMETLFNTEAPELAALGFHPKHIHALAHPDWRAVEKDLVWAESPDHHLITLDHPAYPALLKEIHDPAIVLFVRGNLNALSQKQLGIVGSRHPTPSGLRNAETFARYLAQHQFAITSGLADGIDGAAHRGALAVNGVTIAVMGTGFNHIYPRHHRSLFEEIIAQNGTVISEFPLDAAPHATNFPRRNRLIAGLSQGVLVVEAVIKSGSLITARHALEQGREVFAIPGSIHHPQSRGCHYLIRQGAKLVETASDILEELGGFVDLGIPQKEDNAMINIKNLSRPQQQIFAQIAYEITPIDVILLRSQLTAGEVSSILLNLELQGLIQSVPGGYVRI